jgi:hypothetical protein
LKSIIEELCDENIIDSKNGEDNVFALKLYVKVYYLDYDIIRVNYQIIKSLSDQSIIDVCCSPGRVIA